MHKVKTSAVQNRFVLTNVPVTNNMQVEAPYHWYEQVCVLIHLSLYETIKGAERYVREFVLMRHCTPRPKESIPGAVCGVNATWVIGLCVPIHEWHCFFVFFFSGFFLAKAFQRWQYYVEHGDDLVNCLLTFGFYLSIRMWMLCETLHIFGK